MRREGGDGGGGGGGGGDGLTPGLFARSKWRSAVILKFSRWQGARIGLKNQSGSLFLMITASRSESGNCCCCCCFLPILLFPATSAPSLSLCFLHPRTLPPAPVPPFLFPCLTEHGCSLLFSLPFSPTSLPVSPGHPLAPRFFQSISRTAATLGIIAEHRYRHHQPL